MSSGEAAAASDPGRFVVRYYISFLIAVLEQLRTIVEFLAAPRVWDLQTLQVHCLEPDHGKTLELLSCLKKC